MFWGDPRSLTILKARSVAVRILHDQFAFNPKTPTSSFVLGQLSSSHFNDVVDFFCFVFCFVEEFSKRFLLKVVYILFSMLFVRSFIGPLMLQFCIFARKRLDIGDKLRIMARHLYWDVFDDKGVHSTEGQPFLN